MQIKVCQFPNPYILKPLLKLDIGSSELTSRHKLLISSQEIFKIRLNGFTPTLWTRFIGKMPEDIIKGRLLQYFQSILIRYIYSFHSNDNPKDRVTSRKKKIKEQFEAIILFNFHPALLDKSLISFSSLLLPPRLNLFFCSWKANLWQRDPFTMLIL